MQYFLIFGWIVAVVIGAQCNKPLQVDVSCTKLSDNLYVRFGSCSKSEDTGVIDVFSDKNCVTKPYSFNLKKGKTIETENGYTITMTSCQNAKPTTTTTTTTPTTKSTTHPKPNTTTKHNKTTTTTPTSTNVFPCRQAAKFKLGYSKCSNTKIGHKGDCFRVLDNHFKYDMCTKDDKPIFHMYGTKDINCTKSLASMTLTDKCIKHHIDKIKKNLYIQELPYIPEVVVYTSREDSPSFSKQKDTLSFKNYFCHDYGCVLYSDYANERPILRISSDSSNLKKKYCIIKPTQHMTHYSCSNFTNGMFVSTTAFPLNLGYLSGRDNTQVSSKKGVINICYSRDKKSGNALLVTTGAIMLIISVLLI